MTAKVSIVICVYNGGDFLRPAVESALAQTWPNIEVVLIDDGSTDGCLASIESIDDERLRVFSQPNKGKPAALNHARRVMSGDFYAIQDADDLSYPRRIERQMQCFDEHPEVAAVYTGYDLLVDDRPVGPRFRQKPPEECKRDIQAYRMPAHDPTGMYRVALVGDLAYDEDLRVVEGLDYVLRVGEQHPIMVCGETLYSYRSNPDSVTRSDPTFRIEQVKKVLRRACERRGTPIEDGPEYLRKRTDGKFSRSDVDNNVAVHFIESVLDQRRAGDRRGALAAGLFCARLHPFDLEYLKPLIYSLVPLASLRLLRRRADHPPEAAV
ncbi:MAG: glycosyltransferase involved in cell wall biosynthesis [Chlamydiales bacterium]|jgi:glycosyltransferase involved in cell wall biosynthesis